MAKADVVRLMAKGRRLLVRPRGRQALRWNPHGRRLSDSLIVANELPALRLNDRQLQTEDYMRGLRTSVEEHPEGWSGNGSGDGLADKVQSLLWYHTIDLPGGIVTPGTFDHRPLVAHYQIPEHLNDQLALDIGTWDGFWAFEFERRGARVTAVDLDRLTDVDLPHAISRAVNTSGLDQRFGGGFELARSALGSKVERIVRSIYDLNPADLGTFDLVHVGEVLQHLESPSRALRCVRSVTRGLTIVSGRFDPALPSHTMTYRGGWTNATWWSFSLSALGQMILDAGFSDVQLVSTYQITSGRSGAGSWSAVFHARP